jgi:AmmeMemoRadiSam system protein B
MTKPTISDREIRPSTIDGIFYPDDRQKLSARLHDLLNHTGTGSEERATRHSIIVPHAALDYSGRIAAAAYKTVADRRIETVVLVGPLHRELEESLILPQSKAFQTPLGSISVDERTLQKLAGLSPAFRVDDIPHLEEHCLEAQLPFIQHLFPKASIVPILLGKAISPLVRLLSESLWQLYTDRFVSTLFVITSNMTWNMDEKNGSREAAEVVGWIGNGDWQLLMEAATGKRISTCGAGCVAAILQLNSKLGGTVSLLEQGSSLPMVGDRKKVVHYAAFVLQNR